MSKKINSLYVFVKGKKGKGAFEITDSDFKPLHSASIPEKAVNKLPYIMDLKAIEKSLEYIKDNKGNNGLPKNPVVSIFTTYKVNYLVASGINNPKEIEMIQFMQALKKLQIEFSRPGQKQRDEIKCYWIPDNFENCIEDVKKLLKK